VGRKGRLACPFAARELEAPRRLFAVVEEGEYADIRKKLSCGELCQIQRSRRLVMGFAPRNKEAQHIHPASDEYTAVCVSDPGRPSPEQVATVSAVLWAFLPPSILHPFLKIIERSCGTGCAT